MESTESKELFSYVNQIMRFLIDSEKRLEVDNDGDREGFSHIESWQSELVHLVSLDEDDNAGIERFFEHLNAETYELIEEMVASSRLGEARNCCKKSRLIRASAWLQAFAAPQNMSFKLLRDASEGFEITVSNLGADSRTDSRYLDNIWFRLSVLEALTDSVGAVQKSKKFDRNEFLELYEKASLSGEDRFRASLSEAIRKSKENHENSNAA